MTRDDNGVHFTTKEWLDHREKMDRCVQFIEDLFENRVKLPMCEDEVRRIRRIELSIAKLNTRMAFYAAAAVVLAQVLTPYIIAALKRL